MIEQSANGRVRFSVPTVLQAHVIMVLTGRKKKQKIRQSRHGTEGQVKPSEHLDKRHEDAENVCRI